MKAMMIDLESFGMPPNGQLASIGVTVFDPHSDAIFDTGYWVMNRVNQPNARYDASTIHWWLSQSDAARAAITNHTPKIPLRDALIELHKLYSIHRCAEIWAKPTTFDIILVQNAFEVCGLDFPWHYRDVRDMSTVWHLLKRYNPFQGERAGFEGTPHNALDDAIEQTKQLQQILKVLDGRLNAGPVADSRTGA